METQPGAAIGGFRPPLLGERYVVCERLGRGGTAGVYLVFDLKLRAWHAAKVLHSECANDPEIRRRFAREATTMARLSHPNIVSVVDVAPDDAVPYLVMEYLESGCVLDWVRRHGPMPPALAVKCLIDVCHGLEAVHESGGVHRDVKPHNVLVHRTGACKLTDFGIARLGPPRDLSRSDDVLDDDHHTEVGTVMGTAAFMAPEQRIDASAVDARADVYSAGASLYTLLTAKAAPDLCMAQPDDPRFRDLPDLVVEVLLKACAYSPTERYRDARRMASALAFVARSVHVDDSVPPLAEEPRTLPGRPPARLTAQQARHLGDLVQEGAIRSLYDPHDAHTAPPLADRAIAPPQLDEDGETKLYDGTPSPVLANLETTLNRTQDHDDHDVIVLIETPPPAPELPAPTPLHETPGPPPGIADLRNQARARGSQEAVYEERRRSLIPLFLFMGMVLILIGVSTTVGALTAARGARQVGEAQRLGLETAQRYYSVLHHNQPVIDDLARHGAHREALERAWFNFQDATSNDKHVAAAEFWDVLTDEFQKARSRTSGDSAMLNATAAYQDILSAREDYVRAVDQWDDATQTTPGRLAVSLGLAVPAPETD